MTAFLMLSSLLTCFTYVWYSFLKAITNWRASNVLRKFCINTNTCEIVHDTWFLRGPWFARKQYDVIAMQIYDPSCRELFWMVQRWDTKSDVQQVMRAHRDSKSSCMMFSFEIGTWDTTNEFNKTFFVDVFTVKCIMTVLKCIYRTRHDGPLTIRNLLTDCTTTLQNYDSFKQPDTIVSF